MSYQTILFDLDGTVLDTLDDLTESVNFALCHDGLPPRSREEIRQFVGNGVAKLMERAIPQGREYPGFEACLALFREHYATHMEEKTRPYPGIPELLAELRQLGCRTAILSNKFDLAVKGLAERYFPRLIDIALGEGNGIPPKPAPNGVRTILTRLSCRPENALYIGDSDVDILTAQNAGLASVGVTWGFRSRAVLEQAGADWIVNTPEELLALVKEG